MIDVGSYLRTLLGGSTPGDSIHHLLVAAAPPDAITPLGEVDPARLETTMYAIAPDQTVDAGEYVVDVVRAAIVQAADKGQDIHFAGLSMEVHVAPASAPGAIESRARGSLDRHPAAFGATILYAAARDGRRWTGHHYLTGPKAGAPIGPTEFTGPIHDDERGVHRALIRTAVGLSRA